jgi:TPR repeat protein
LHKATGASPSLSFPWPPLSDRKNRRIGAPLLVQSRRGIALLLREVSSPAPQSIGARLARCCAMLLAGLALAGCDGVSGGVDDLLSAVRETTIKPLEKIIGGEPSEAKVDAGKSDGGKDDAALAQAVPYIKPQAAPPPANVLSELRAAAERGHAPSQNALGVMYDKGRGVERDPGEAVKWYRKAAEQGLASAQFNLALMYRAGTGVAKDDAAAFAWFEKAARQGAPEAQYMAALQLEDGVGTGRDAAAAVRWYAQAASSGYAPAQHNLAVAYATGVGIAKDEEAAATWYRRAADQGQPKSQLLIAQALARGAGVPRDRPEAYIRFKLAAASAGSDEQLRRDAEAQAESLAKEIPKADLEKARRDLQARLPARA